MDVGKAQAIVSSTAYRMQQNNKPFLEAVERSTAKGVPEEMAYRLTWYTYYQNGKDALLGDHRSAEGLTAAESRAKHAQMAQQAAQLGISVGELYDLKKAAEGMTEFVKSAQGKYDASRGGRTRRSKTSSRGRRSKKTSKRRQSR